MAYDQRDYSGAQSLHAESLALMREIGNARGIASAIRN